MASDFVGPQPLKTNHPMPFNGNDSTALLRKIPRMIEVDFMKFKASHFNGVTFEISSESLCKLYSVHSTHSLCWRNSCTMLLQIGKCSTNPWLLWRQNPDSKAVRVEPKDPKRLTETRTSRTSPLVSISRVLLFIARFLDIKISQLHPSNQKGARWGQWRPSHDHVGCVSTCQ